MEHARVGNRAIESADGGPRVTRRSVVSRFACVALLLTTQGVAESTLDPAAQASPVTRETSDTEPVQTAKSIFANQPAELVKRLMKKKLIVMQEVREEGSLRGGLVSSYVIRPGGEATVLKVAHAYE